MVQVVQTDKLLVELEQVVRVPVKEPSKGVVMAELVVLVVRVLAVEAETEAGAEVPVEMAV